MTTAARAVAAGLLLTLALPPFGWWPLAIVGAALAVAALDGTTGRRRAIAAGAMALGFLGPGLWWMSEFTAPGFVLAVLFESALLASGLFLGRGRWGLIGAVTFAEAFRASWPWGGVPVPTIAHTQAGGPLGQVARVGGELVVAALVVAAGIALADAWRRRWVHAGATSGAVLALVVIGLVAPRGSAIGTLEVAAVQGGGERGTRAIDTDEDVVFQRHLDASDGVPDGVDLVVWPENVVHVDTDVHETPEGAALAALARSLDATLVAGVVIGGEAEQQADVFINLAVGWDDDGEPLGRYEKNTRVPFGEFIPFRSLVESIADVSAVPRDARVGRGPGFLTSPAGDLGVVISWEVFFADRARDAISTGGEVLLVPTNAASFSTSQMPSLELAAARLRAIETGRFTIQAAPTGFTAVVSPEGDVLARTGLGERDVITATVERREGETIYTKLGDGPFVVAGTTMLARVWLRRRGRLSAWRTRRTTGTRPPTDTTTADTATETTTTPAG